jgi:opacity protein-like surface antigen
MKPRVLIALLGLASLGVPARADADLTAFVGVNPTPSKRTVTGVALGVGVLVVGFEFEYANTKADDLHAAPSLKTGMFNLLAQTPEVSGFQVYGTIGGGVYQEQLGDRKETQVGVNVGGGVKISLAGPLRLRVDYRIYTLRGEPLESKPQRFYAGLNLAF